VVNGREIIRALQRAGFVVDRQTGSHVILVSQDGEREVSVPSHGGRDLPVGTVRGIIKDAGLTVEEFRRLLQ
jgi:predicted RNA binding protein YcfA (HicA-like mRNA interferase family)